jgi:hypothetical protein
MTLSLNRTELIGRLGQDPDMRYTPSGQAVTTFSIATDRPAKPDGESTTDWHQVACWDKLAEFTNLYLIPDKGAARLPRWSPAVPDVGGEGWPEAANGRDRGNRAHRARPQAGAATAGRELRG